MTLRCRSLHTHRGRAAFGAGVRAKDRSPSRATRAAQMLSVPPPLRRQRRDPLWRSFATSAAVSRCRRIRHHLSGRACGAVRGPLVRRAIHDSSDHQSAGQTAGRRLDNAFRLSLPKLGCQRLRVRRATAVSVGHGEHQIARIEYLGQVAHGTDQRFGVDADQVRDLGRELHIVQGLECDLD